MLNQVVLVGRLTENVKDNREWYEVNLAIPRSYKNAEGEYETDYVRCIAKGGVGSKANEYCKKGDIIGVKGRLESGVNKELIVMAEKLTFLSSNNNN